MKSLAPPSFIRASGLMFFEILIIPHATPCVLASYPYVFLNDEPFTEDFKRGIQSLVSTTADFGLIPPEHWGKHPAWVDELRAARARQAMADAKVPYGDSVSYREMCRYQSGFFYDHPLLQKQ